MFVTGTYSGGVGILSVEGDSLVHLVDQTPPGMPPNEEAGYKEAQICANIICSFPLFYDKEDEKTINVEEFKDDEGNPIQVSFGARIVIMNEFRQIQVRQIKDCRPKYQRNVYKFAMKNPKAFNFGGSTISIKQESQSAIGSSATFGLLKDNASKFPSNISVDSKSPFVFSTALQDSTTKQATIKQTTTSLFGASNPPASKPEDSSKEKILSSFSSNLTKPNQAIAPQEKVNTEPEKKEVKVYTSCFDLFEDLKTNTKFKNQWSDPKYLKLVESAKGIETVIKKRLDPAKLQSLKGLEVKVQTSFKELEKMQTKNEFLEEHRKFLLKFKKDYEEEKNQFQKNNTFYHLGSEKDERKRKTRLLHKAQEIEESNERMYKRIKMTQDRLGMIDETIKDFVTAFKPDHKLTEEFIPNCNAKAMTHFDPRSVFKMTSTKHNQPSAPSTYNKWASSNNFLGPKNDKPRIDWKSFKQTPYETEQKHEENLIDRIKRPSKEGEKIRSEPAKLRESPWSDRSFDFKIRNIEPEEKPPQIRKITSFLDNYLKKKEREFDELHRMLAENKGKKKGAGRSISFNLEDLEDENSFLVSSYETTNQNQILNIMGDNYNRTRIIKQIELQEKLNRIQKPNVKYFKPQDENKVKVEEAKRLSEEVPKMKEALSQEIKLDVKEKKETSTKPAAASGGISATIAAPTGINMGANDSSTSQKTDKMGGIFGQMSKKEEKSEPGKSQSIDFSKLKHESTPDKPKVSEVSKKAEAVVEEKKKQSGISLFGGLNNQDKNKELSKIDENEGDGEDFDDMPMKLSSTISRMSGIEVKKDSHQDSMAMQEGPLKSKSENNSTEMFGKHSKTQSQKEEREKPKETSIFGNKDSNTSDVKPNMFSTSVNPDQKSMFNSNQKTQNIFSQNMTSAPVNNDKMEERNTNTMEEGLINESHVISNNFFDSQVIQETKPIGVFDKKPLSTANEPKATPKQELKPQNLFASFGQTSNNESKPPSTPQISNNDPSKPKGLFDQANTNSSGLISMNPNNSQSQGLNFGGNSNLSGLFSTNPKQGEPVSTTSGFGQTSNLSNLSKKPNVVMGATGFGAPSGMGSTGFGQAGGTPSGANGVNNLFIQNGQAPQGSWMNGLNNQTQMGQPSVNSNAMSKPRV